MLLPETFAHKFDGEGAFPRLSRRLRLGVVGGGRIATTQAVAAQLSNHWEVVAGAFSSNPERAKAAASAWHLSAERCYESFAAMAEQEATREDGVEAVMITTPNHLHYPAAKAFLEAGINVLCDKPLTNEVAEAVALAEQVKGSGCVFGVSYVMSCFPMIRQAREIVASGGLGAINQIHAEFMQDWMTPDSATEAPHVKWRLDPAKSGKTSCVGDIGTHAAHLASFVSGLRLTHLRAEFHICGAPKQLEDTFFAWTRHSNTAQSDTAQSDTAQSDTAQSNTAQSNTAQSNTAQSNTAQSDTTHSETVPGTLMATRLAPGNRGGLRLRIYGDQGGLAWDMEQAEQLKFSRFGEPDRILTRGQGHGVSPKTERFVRTGRGFPEGIIEAWANLYTEFAMAVAAHHDGIALPDDWLALPRIEDGVDGVRFIEACVRSNEARGAWMGLAG